MVRLILSAVLLVLPVAATAFPVFRDGTVVYCSGDTLKAGSISSPMVTDWNGDGCKDLVVADVETISGTTYGLLRFYENTGSNAQPVFNSFTYLQADGFDIHTQGYC